MMPPWRDDLPYVKQKLFLDYTDITAVFMWECIIIIIILFFFIFDYSFLWSGKNVFNLF